MIDIQQISVRRVARHRDAAEVGHWVQLYQLTDRAQPAQKSRNVTTGAFLKKLWTLSFETTLVHHNSCLRQNPMVDV